MYDGTVIECRRIEFSMDGTKVIVDGDRVFPISDIFRIVRIIPE